jgi:hypothetical protein
LNTARCNFFSTKGRWLIYTSTGVSHDPDRIIALFEFPPPHNAGDLMQFLCARQWFALHIPHFAQHVAPLRQLLELLLKGSTDHTKKAAKRIPIPDSL